MSFNFSLSLNQTTNLVKHCRYLGAWQQRPVNFLTPVIFYNIVAMCVANGVAGIVTATANILIIISILQSRLLRAKPFMLLLVSLSITDFFVGVALQPIWILVKVFEIHKRQALACNFIIIARVLGVTCTGTSLGHVSLISIERNLAVRLAARYKSIVSFRKTVTSIAFVWIFFILYAILPVTVFPQIGTLVGRSIIIGINVLITVICYLGVFFKMGLSNTVTNSESRLSTTTKQRIKKDKKVAKIMIFVVVVLALFYIPEMIVTVLATKNPQSLNLIWIGLNWTRTIVFTNSLVNPFLYCWKFKQLRQGVFKLIGRTNVTNHQSRVLSSQVEQRTVNILSVSFQYSRKNGNVAISSNIK